MMHRDVVSPPSQAASRSFARALVICAIRRPRQSRPRTPLKASGLVGEGLRLSAVVGVARGPSRCPPLLREFDPFSLLVGPGDNSPPRQADWAATMTVSAQLLRLLFGSFVASRWPGGLPPKLFAVTSPASRSSAGALACPRCPRYFARSVRVCIVRCSCVLCGLYQGVMLAQAKHREVIVHASVSSSRTPVCCDASARPDSYQKLIG